MHILRRPALSCLLLCGVAAASGHAAPGEPFLADPVQLTFADQFSRAGEAYFSPDGRWVIFQAVPANATTNAYAMFVARLTRDDRTGLVT